MFIFPTQDEWNDMTDEERQEWLEEEEHADMYGDAERMWRE